MTLNVDIGGYTTIKYNVNHFIPNRHPKWIIVIQFHHKLHQQKKRYIYTLSLYGIHTNMSMIHLLLCRAYYYYKYTQKQNINKIKNMANKTQMNYELLSLHSQSTKCYIHSVHTMPSPKLQKQKKNKKENSKLTLNPHRIAYKSGCTTIQLAFCFFWLYEICARR